MSETHTKSEVILNGIAASPGVAHGTALVYLQRELAVPCYDVKESMIEGEIERFDQAILKTRGDITSVRNKIADSLGEGEARIFDAHLMVLEDAALIDEVILELRTTSKNIEFCYNKVAQRYVSFFSSMEDEYLKERVSDIVDVSSRLLHNLVGMQTVSLGELAADCIVVSEDISPSNAAELDHTKLLGFITDHGGKTGHSVIMARSLRIPAVVGMHDATRKIRSGDQILVDGHEGIVVINPSKDRLYQYGKLATKRRRLDELYRSAIGHPSETSDGYSISIMANIEGSQDMERVANMSADGVGLYRTEGIFLRKHGYPDESAQFEEYLKVVESAQGKPVTIRTLDVGGDKTLDDQQEKEDNSFMGFRAIRFCLETPDVFKTQLRAILRASAFGDVSIMYPMISGLVELRRANDFLDSVKDELRQEGVAFDANIKVGTMIEVPSAAAIVDLIAKETDFLSIGTNDLIQYLMAVDRLNDKVAHLYEPTHPAVLRTLQSIINAGKRENIPVSICGEMAGDPLYASLLVGMGATSLSLAASLLPEVKYYIRKMESLAAKALVGDLLQIADSTEVINRLSEFRKNTLGELV